MTTTRQSVAFRAVDKHPEEIRFPLMEQPVVGFLLALIAGLLNAWSLSTTQTFATVQSGNVVSSGYYLVTGDWHRLTVAALSVLFFGLGSALCGVLITTMWRRKRSYTAPVMFALTVLLAVFATLSATNAWDPVFIAWGVSFVAGAQGNAFHKDHGMLYGAVAVTFVVQMAFNFLAQSFFARTGINGDPNIKWAGLFFFVLLGFAGGGAVGVLADQVFSGASMACAALITGALGIAAIRTRAAAHRADPTPGGTFS